MEVLLADVYGFCEGVKSALNITLRALNEKEKPIYLIGNLVHNEHLMSWLKDNGVIILTKGTLKERIQEVKKGTLIFSAHGHDESLHEYVNPGVNLIDATCFRVKDIKQKIKSLLNFGNIFYIGIENHEEANSCLAISNKIMFINYKKPLFNKNLTGKIYVFNQSTLSLLELKEIHDEILKVYPDAYIFNDICKATTSRQLCLMNINDSVDYIFILGDKNSSNSLRLYDICKNKYPKKNVMFFSSLDEVKEYNIDNSKKVFISAGASTPDFIINPIIEYLKAL